MYLVSRQILPLMADGGRIVNLSSVLGRFGVPGYTAYCATKHGVIGFTRALALEVVKRKITVNAIAPGWVETDMAALGMTQGAKYAKVSFDEFKDRADRSGADQAHHRSGRSRCAGEVPLQSRRGRDYRADLQYLRRPDDGLGGARVCA